jgi:hypothetical protein
MRIGQNPAKYIKAAAKPERITVAVLNYIPFQSGFYAEVLDVLKACLESIWEGADLPYDLMVFDNGSCEEALQYLVDKFQKGRIQYLVLSDKNLGKGGAWNHIFGAAPGEIIAYCDNDVHFSKGWLSRSVELLEHYPKVGMVTSRPFRTREEFSTATVEWAQHTPKVKLERGEFISWKSYLEFNLSLGAPEEEIRKKFAVTEDIRVTYKGKEAQVGASHWQFLSYKSVLQQFLPFNMEKPMGQVRQLDERMNQTGLLRLMVTTPLAANMSNTPVISSKAGTARSTRHKTRKTPVFFEWKPVKKALLALYDVIFRMYNKE